jgi:VWFA-related protein
MSRRVYPVCAFLLLSVLVGFPATHAMPQAPTASPAQVPLDLVPVDIQVVDRSGKPVADLKQTDFTVTEDGVAQQIRHFTLQAPAPDTSSPDAAPTLRKGMAWSPQNRRMFVIALGLGRLEVPSGYISGLLRFVKTRLLPQDQVALFAYDRALSFTTDHQKIAEALERFKKSHEDVDFALGLELGATGMAPLYGSRVLPRKLQTRIDEMVLGPGAKPASRTSDEAIEPEAFGGMSLDDFMASSATTLKDQDNLMALMEYLRRFDGHKDVLFVTEKGLLWPSDENDRALASVANDARVSIHALQAGGMLAAESGRELNATSQQAMSFRSLRTIADLTGGLAAITENGQAVIDRLDEMTRTSYVLGYRASNTGWDGGYRTIDVKVNRPDVKVLFRHGYFRASGSGAFDRRGFVANSRLGAAANFRREVNDIKVKASASQRGGVNLAVEGKIDLSKVKVTTLGGLRVGRFNVAVFCLDSAGNPMGTHMQELPLQSSEEEYARFLKSGFPYLIEFPAIRGTRNIRLVVYDFGSDLLGRVDTNVF